MGLRKQDREVILPGFYGSGDLERGDLGWGKSSLRHREAGYCRRRLLNSAENYNVAFYHLPTEKLYCLHFDECPIALKEHPLDPKIPRLLWRINSNSWLDGRYIAIFHNPEEVWDTLRIDGRNLEQLIGESYLFCWEKFMLQRNSLRDIVIPEFYGPNDHLYRDELGCPIELRRSARTANAYKVFDYLMNLWANVDIFDPVTHIWWGIHAERKLAPVGRMPYDPTQPYEMMRWGQDTHDMEEKDIVCYVIEPQELWRQHVFAGRTLEELFRDGYINSSRG